MDLDRKQIAPAERATHRSIGGNGKARRGLDSHCRRLQVARVTMGTRWLSYTLTRCQPPLRKRAVKAVQRAAMSTHMPIHAPVRPPLK